MTALPSSAIGHAGYDRSVRLVEGEANVSLALALDSNAYPDAGAIRPAEIGAAAPLGQDVDPQGLIGLFLSEMTPSQRSAGWWSPAMQLHGLQMAWAELSDQAAKGTLSPAGAHAQDALVQMLERYELVRVGRMALMEG